MIITSRSRRRNCPICGAADCSCGGPTTVGLFDGPGEAVMSGKLVRVQLRPGVYVRMLEEQARLKGLLTPPPCPLPDTERGGKAGRPAEDKAQEPGPNKRGRGRPRKG